ncbi:MAG: hypothetical protein WCI61_00675 [Chloroflexota bacterium]
MIEPPHGPLGRDLDALAASLARDLSEVRAGLIEALDGVSELWLQRMLRGDLAREGWTVQHEAARHAADDALLVAMLEHAARGIEGWSATEARRLRGEAMHVVQRARLAPLREHLAASGERAAEALQAHAAHLDRPFAVGDIASRAIVEVLRAQAERARARAGVDAVRATFQR